MKINLKYESLDWGLESCEILYKGTDNTYLILTKGTGKDAPDDCIIVATYDRKLKHFKDVDINWLNVKKGTVKQQTI